MTAIVCKSSVALRFAYKEVIGAADFGLNASLQIAWRGLRELEAAITSYIDAQNADPKPFRWVKSAGDILASMQRFRRRTNAVQDSCA